MTTVTVNGCFCPLHCGHLFLLGFAWGQGEQLVVGINSDEYIRSVKKYEPIPEAERIAYLMRLGCVSRVVVFNENDPREFIRSVHPYIHCIGVEYKGRAVEEPLCQELGIRIAYVPRVGNWSSTSLRNGSGV